MEVKWLKDDKNEADIEIDNLTITEILRVYLNEDEAVSLAAWRREHPSKNPILKIRTKGKTAKKALSDAVAKIEKDADSLVARFKKAKA